MGSNPILIEFRFDASDLVTTRLPLPLLSLPTPSSHISAHVDIPPIIHLHQPFTIVLRLSNMHPTYIAVLTVQIETSDNFVWTGNRLVRLPPLEGGQSVHIKLEGIAIGGMGPTEIPTVRVWEGEGDGPREVNVDGRSETFVRP